MIKIAKRTNGKKELAKKYSHWIDLKLRREKYIAEDETHIKRLLDRCRRYIKTPQKARFIPELLHKESGHVYRTYFNVVRSNINKSYNNLRDRIKKSIDREVKLGHITKTEGAELKKTYLHKVEMYRQQRLSRFNSLDKTAQNLYKQAIKKLTQWGKAGVLPPIERGTGWKYLPKGTIRKKARKIQEPINARIAAHRKHLREIYKKMFGNRPIRYGSKEYRQWRKIIDREYREWQRQIPTQRPKSIQYHNVSTKRKVATLPKPGSRGYTQWKNPKTGKWEKIDIATRTKVGERTTPYQNISIFRR